MSDAYKKAQADIVNMLFAENSYTTHLIKTQELMLTEFCPTDLFFDATPSESGFPEPPIDIRAPLICLYALLTANARFEPDMLPFLVSPRVC